MEMASCPVPDFPAVIVALEHLKELDKQLKDDGIPFSSEASLHLTEVTAAVTELEAERRAAHEQLEVENIENSKLRHQINNIRERMTRDIMADVAAARTSNAEEMEQLLKELAAVSQLQEATVKRQEALQSQNNTLNPEREHAKAECEEIVAALNEQITFKYGLQMQVDQTKDQIEELKSCTAAVEQDKITLHQNMALEREAFSVKHDNLSREADEAEEKIKQQKQSVKRRRRELDRVNNKKRETYSHLDELTVHMAKLESNLRQLTTSRRQCEKQLEGETRYHTDLRQQRETLRKELCELKEALGVSLQHLKEEIAAVEAKMEKGRESRSLHQDSLTRIRNIFKRQYDEENEEREELFHVFQQLERSKLQLEERVASIVKHSQEIKEMDKQIAEHLEANTINKHIFERNQEELCDNVSTGKRDISHLKEEKMRLTMLLEEAERKQEEHVAIMTSDISSTRRRYQELRQEEAALQQRRPQGVDADSLMSHVTQCEVEYRQKETKHRQEIEQCTAETEIITKNNEEKQREVEEHEERLKEVEATWNKEQSRHQRLKLLTSELQRQSSDLELSIQVLKEKTGPLLEPKEERKAELEAMREDYMTLLNKQASELRAVEINIYDNKVRLEQVNMENSRLHLCVTQMTESISRTKEDTTRYRQEVHRLKQNVKAVFESLQDAWKQDVLLTQDCQSRDDVLLKSMSDMLNSLKTKTLKLENVSTVLHQHMLDFSKRLGDKTTGEQRTYVSADI